MAPPVHPIANPAPTSGPSIQRHDGYYANELATTNISEWRIRVPDYEVGAIDKNKDYQGESGSNDTREARPPSKEITSFLDSDSELEENRSDVVQRADTVRVCRPRLVQHMPPTTAMKEKFNAGGRENVQQMQIQRFVGPSNHGEYARPGYRPDIGLPVDGSGPSVMLYQSYQPSIDESLPDSITDCPVSVEEGTGSLDIVYSPIRNRTGELQSHHGPGINRRPGPRPTTPAPARTATTRPKPKPGIYVQTEGVGDERCERGFRATPYPWSRHSSLATSGGKKAQRPQGRSTDEVLLIVLGLPGRWDRRCITIITIPAKYHGKFDDAALFKQIRKSYHCNLLPMWKRCLNFRSLDRVFLRMSSTRDSPSRCRHLNETGRLHLQGVGRFGFNAASFLVHLQYPKKGTGNTTWLVWLRQHQELFAPDSRTHGSRNNGSNEAGLSYTWEGFERPHSFRNFRESSFPGGGGELVGSTAETGISLKAIIQLQHLLSPVLVSSAVIFIFLLSILATVLYIILSPDTFSPRASISTPISQAPSLDFRHSLSSKDWKLVKVSFDTDHQARQNWWSLASVRVPAGFLVGFVVLAFGVVSLLGWIGVAMLAWRRSTGSMG